MAKKQVMKIYGSKDTSFLAFVFSVKSLFTQEGGREMTNDYSFLFPFVFGFLFAVILDNATPKKRKDKK